MSDNELDLVESVMLLKTLSSMLSAYADELFDIDLDVRNGLTLINHQVHAIKAILDKLYAQSDDSFN